MLLNKKLSESFVWTAVSAALEVTSAHHSVTYVVIVGVSIIFY